MKKILVSECLYGSRIVRYDGGDTKEKDPLFLKWKKEGRLIPFCPEVFSGLPIPRPDSERVGEKVRSETGADVTEAYVKGAREALRLAREKNAAFAIMKEDSPSCGSHTIYDGTFTETKKIGQGLAVEYLRNAGFRVFSEKELSKAEKALRELESE